MAKFQFHLEPVLKQRAAKEVSAEQALALARKEYNRRLTLLENTRQSLQALEATGRDGLDYFEIRQHFFYRASINEKIKVQEKGVSAADRVVAHKRDEAVQARRERQVLDKLKEQCVQNYRRELADREQKEVDELSLSIYHRRVN
ncbi:Flagellar FliJ protein [Pelotomaculum sp. FP]|uniref:flagellar export protein FliJ n=1 Tax=Pelotomaculum sp. FP TaxID=261474 RepID=UPI0010670FB0|nr:flagellar export protein FliJ [Pelotomaculum sp. FP]TEB15925.1 Flagellar FliJ protein [Pelotomaculum sp. FP]